MSAMRVPHANLHVRVAGRWNWRYALLCRDFLRAHPGTAAAYGEVKRRLFPDDAESYYEVKGPVFDLFMSLADEWPGTYRVGTGGQRRVRPGLRSCCACVGSG